MSGLSTSSATTRHRVDLVPWSTIFSLKHQNYGAFKQHRRKTIISQEKLQNIIKVKDDHIKPIMSFLNGFDSFPATVSHHILLTPFRFGGIKQLDPDFFLNP